MRKRGDEAELALIGVSVLGRLVVKSARPEHDVNDGISEPAGRQLFEAVIRRSE